MTDAELRTLAEKPELLTRLEKLPEYDRGFNWQLRDRYTGSERIECYGELANLFKWIIDHWEDAIADLTRITKLEAANAWQQIDTAPKDGTKIDLWARFEKSGWRRVPDAYWNDKVDGWQLGQYNAADYMVAPVITHWMPLPAPPTLSEKDQRNDQ